MTNKFQILSSNDQTAAIRFGIFFFEFWDLFVFCYLEFVIYYELFQKQTGISVT